MKSGCRWRELTKQQNPSHWDESMGDRLTRKDKNVLKMDTKQGFPGGKGAERSASDRTGSDILSDFKKLAVHLHKTNNLINPRIK
jgi:hypothetical protein